MKILEFISNTGANPFAKWFDDLDPQAAAKITTAIVRIEQSNLSNVKSVGSGVHEYRIHAGAGYRIYLGKDGDTIIILLGGGTKRRQNKDIEAAIRRWQEYKHEKRKA